MLALISLDLLLPLLGCEGAVSFNANTSSGLLCILSYVTSQSWNINVSLQFTCILHVMFARKHADSEVYFIF